MKHASKSTCFFLGLAGGGGGATSGDNLWILGGLDRILAILVDGCYDISLLHGQLCLYKYLYISGTQITSIFEGQPPQNPSPIKTRVIWVPGIYIIYYIF